MDYSSDYLSIIGSILYKNTPEAHKKILEIFADNEFPEISPQEKQQDFYINLMTNNILESKIEGGVCIMTGYQSKITIMYLNDIFFASKKIKDEYKKYFYRESLNNMLCCHPYINQVVSCDSLKYTISTFVKPFGSLEQLVTLPEEYKPLFCSDIFAIFYKITYSIEYLHNLNLIHRDIKPMNFFIGPSFEPFLGDFGCSRILPVFNHNPQMTTAGTYLFMAPEIIKGDKNYDKRVDTHSLMSSFVFCFKKVKPYSNLINFDSPEFLKKILDTNQKPYDESFFTKDSYKIFCDAWDETQKDFDMKKFRESIKKIAEESQSILDKIEKNEDLNSILKNYHEQTDQRDTDTLNKIPKKIIEKCGSSNDVIKKIVANNLIIEELIHEWWCKDQKPDLISILDEAEKMTEELIKYPKIRYDTYGDIIKCKEKIKEVSRKYNAEENMDNYFYGKLDNLIVSILSNHIDHKKKFPYKSTSPFQNPRERDVSSMNITTIEATYKVDNTFTGIVIVYYQDKEKDSLYVAGQYQITKTAAIAQLYGYGTSLKSAMNGMFPTNNLIEAIDRGQPYPGVAIREVMSANIEAKIGNEKFLLIRKGQPLEAIGFALAKSNVCIIYYDGEPILTQKCEISDLVKVTIKWGGEITVDNIRLLK